MHLSRVRVLRVSMGVCPTRFCGGARERKGEGENVREVLLCAVRCAMKMGPLRFTDDGRGLHSCSWFICRLCGSIVAALIAPSAMTVSLLPLPPRSAIFRHFFSFRA